jgi:hypothetical protein
VALYQFDQLAPLTFFIGFGKPRVHAPVQG